SKPSEGLPRGCTSGAFEYAWRNPKRPSRMLAGARKPPAARPPACAHAERAARPTNPPRRERPGVQSGRGRPAGVESLRPGAVGEELHRARGLAAGDPERAAEPVAVAPEAARVGAAR